MNSIRLLLLYIIKLNGLYDILCAMSILDIGITIPVLQNIHLSMFLSSFDDKSSLENTQHFSTACQEVIGDSSLRPEINKNELIKCIMAYWIFTYGIIRMFSSESRVIEYSYYIEAAFIANESLVKKTMRMDKAYFVICSSILLGYLVKYSGAL